MVCGWCFADAKSRRKRKRGTTETAVSSINFNHCWFRGSLGCLSSKLFPGNRRKRRDLESTTHSNHRRHSRLTVCWLLGHRIVCVFSQPSFSGIFFPPFPLLSLSLSLFMLWYKFLTRSRVLSIPRIGYLPSSILVPPVPFFLLFSSILFSLCSRYVTNNGAVELEQKTCKFGSWSLLDGESFDGMRQPREREQRLIDGGRSGWLAAYADWEWFARMWKSCSWFRKNKGTVRADLCIAR